MLYALVRAVRARPARPREAERKSKFYRAFVLNCRVVLHAIDATPARWRDTLVDFHTGQEYLASNGYSVEYDFYAATGVVPGVNYARPPV